MSFVVKIHIKIQNFLGRKEGKPDAFDDLGSFDHFVYYHMVNGGVIVDVYMPRNGTEVRDLKKLVGSAAYRKKDVIASRCVAEREFTYRPWRDDITVGVVEYTNTMME